MRTWPPSVMSGAASFAMRMNEWQETSIARLKPSAEQSISPPCNRLRERNGVQEDVEPAPARSQRVEERFQLSGTLDVERQEDRRLELAREARRGLRLLVEIGNRELGADAAKCAGAAVGDRMLVGDADDERLLSGENGVMRLGRGAWHCLEPARVARDHQFLVGRDDPCGDSARSGADAGTVLRVRLRVELDAEPGGLAAHALADCDGALADAGGERRSRRGRRAPRRASPARVRCGRRRAPPPAWRAAPSDSSSTRMSLETPETPSRPDCW